MEDDPLIGLLLLQLFFILLNAALLPSPRAFWLLYRYQSHLPAS